jgi:hypothetical protein
MHQIFLSGHWLVSSFSWLDPLKSKCLKFQWRQLYHFFFFAYPKVTNVFSSVFFRDFLVLDFTFWFISIYFCLLIYRWRFIFLECKLSCSSTIYRKVCCCAHWITLASLSVVNWPCICRSFSRCRSVPGVLISILMPAVYCLDYCSFIGNLEIK